MEIQTNNLNDIAQFIHLAVAPIFLLTALATTLLVLANRLARIVDRGRTLQTRATPEDKRLLQELLLLEKRAHLIYRTLTLGVLAAILVCFLMTLVFAGEIFRMNVARAVALLFMTALFSYTGALMILLREVFLAIGNFSFGIHTFASPRPEGKQ